MYHCMQHLFRYLKGTKEMVRESHTADSSKNAEDLVALTDASFATEVEGWRSTSGYFVFYGKSLLEAISSTQKQIATSAPEAELYKLLRTTKVLLYPEGLFRDFGESRLDLSILTDSSSSVSTV